MGIKSEKNDVYEYIKNHNITKVTLDIETMDSKSSISNLRIEPIVSFSLSFIPDDSNVISDFPTFAFAIEDINEELNLLILLRDIFQSLPVETIIVGHNVSFELPCKIECRFKNTHGFDIPKILARSSKHDLDLDFLKNFKNYDTMEVAYRYIIHSEHKILNKGGHLKKFLSSVELESFFNIRRPSDIPKLGSRVRTYFLAGKYNDMILYNCSDTIIESLFYKIFEHKLNVCPRDDGRISIIENCKHIPGVINVEDLATWKSLINDIKTA